ncbi:MAG TPA: hypothetical protein VKS21_10530 [Spirochaetota bacterium]|nr:hypothetical protein [Spirochaetota bacterium]
MQKKIIIYSIAVILLFVGCGRIKYRSYRKKAAQGKVVLNREWSEENIYRITVVGRWNRQKYSYNQDDEKEYKPPQILRADASRAAELNAFHNLRRELSERNVELNNTAGINQSIVSKYYTEEHDTIITYRIVINTNYFK